MSEIQIQVQSTPNPNALKFIASSDVKSEGKSTYKNPEQCPNNHLAQKLFQVDTVSELHFFENVITVTKTPMAEWAPLEEQITGLIKTEFAAHNPDYEEIEAQKPKRVLPEELQKVDEILERTIRPSLRMDGGDLDVVSLDGNVLTINYQGACGSCPSSQMGTLQAIQGILQDEYNPDIVVVTQDTYDYGYGMY